MLDITQAGLSAAVGDQVRAYPGCDHSLITCANKFGNSLNFGGFPFMPEKNPMDGTPVF